MESVVTENGRIVDVGLHHDMTLHWGRAGTKIVDLQGKMATPGLIDSHLHLSMIGFYLLNLDLKGVTSKRDMLEKIRESEYACSRKVVAWDGVGWGGTVVLDPNTQKPTGLLLETASNLITEHIPENTYEERKGSLRQTLLLRNWLLCSVSAGL